MLLSTLFIVLAADPKISGDANIMMKVDGKNEYAAGVHATMPIAPAHLAVSVDLTSKTVADAPTMMGGFSVTAKSWALGVTMKSGADGLVQPCVNARATLVNGPSSLTAQINVAPTDALDKVTGNVSWVSTRVPVAVNVSASTRGAVSVGLSVSSP